MLCLFRHLRSNFYFNILNLCVKFIHSNNYIKYFNWRPNWTKREFFENHIWPKQLILQSKDWFYKVMLFIFILAKLLYFVYGLPLYRSSQNKGIWTVWMNWKIIQIISITGTIRRKTKKSERKKLTSNIIWLKRTYFFFF